MITVKKKVRGRTTSETQFDDISDAMRFAEDKALACFPKVFTAFVVESNDLPSCAYTPFTDGSGCMVTHYNTLIQYDLTRDSEGSHVLSNLRTMGK